MSTDRDALLRENNQRFVALVMKRTFEMFDHVAGNDMKSVLAGNGSKWTCWLPNADVNAYTFLSRSSREVAVIKLH